MPLNTQTTIASELSSAIKTWYDKKLIRDMKPKLVHLQYAQLRPVPKNGGKSVSFRRWTPFAACTTALNEGVVPNGQDLSVSEVSATLEGYGGYVAISDMLDMTSVDPVVNEAIALMADQGALSIDTLVRNALHTGTNVVYAGGGASRAGVAADDILTTTLLRQAARDLKKRKAPQFMRNGKGYYIAIVGPDTVYDLQSDSTWVDVSKYQASEQIFSGEIGRIFGVIVVETPEAMIFAADGHIIPGVQSLTAKASGCWNAGTKTLGIQQAIAAGEVAAYANRRLAIAGTDVQIASATAGAAGSAALVLTQDPGAAVTAAWDGATLYPGNGGATGNSVASTLVLGQNAYGVVDIANEKSGNARTIIKPAGSGGTSDPLDQISTVGWKVDAFATRILQQAWLVRIEHGISQ